MHLNIANLFVGLISNIKNRHVSCHFAQKPDANPQTRFSGLWSYSFHCMIKQWSHSIDIGDDIDKCVNLHLLYFSGDAMPTLWSPSDV